jgi:glycosyltransferase involved in cell wall biosynthesis
VELGLFGIAMKVIMLCDLYIHALQYQENLLSKYYIKQGHQVTIVASTFDSVFNYMSDMYNSKISPSVEIIEGIKIIKLPYSLNILNKIRKFGGVSKIINTEKPDVIFAHSIHLNLKEAVKYKKKNPDTKIIMDYHADYSNSAKNWFSLNILHRVIRKYFLNCVIKYIDKIYPVVPACLFFLHEVYRIPLSKMEILPLGADIDVANETKMNNRGQMVRKKFNISDDDYVIFTGGKLDVNKRTHLLIEAFIILSNPHLHLLVIGESQGKDSSYKEKLEIMCKGNKQIYFTGWLTGNEVYDYMDASNFAVFPASNSVLWQQAIGMGLPLIVGQLRNQSIMYLNKNNNMIVIDEDNINANELSEKIKLLIDDPELLSTMKTGAIKTSDEFLSYDKIVSQTLEFHN